MLKPRLGPNIEDDESLLVIRKARMPFGSVDQAADRLLKPVPSYFS